MADPLTLAQIMKAREILDANSVPAPDMYFDRRTGEWFRRDGDRWAPIPEIEAELFPEGQA
jgi:hypothetical protein